MAGTRKRPKPREEDGCFVTDIYKPDDKRTTISFGGIGDRSEGGIYAAFGQWLDLFGQHLHKVLAFRSPYEAIDGILNLRAILCVGQLHGKYVEWIESYSTSMRDERCNGPGVPCKGALFQQVEVLPRQRSSRPGSYPSSYGGDEVAEAWETKGGVRPSASWQAVTRVNTETAPKDTMRRPTLPGLGEGWYGPDAVFGRQVRSASPG